MSTRKITVILGIVLFIGALIIGNILSSGGADDSDSAPLSVIVAVPVIDASNDTVTTRINFTGNVIPQDKIDIYSEVPGILKSSTREFKAGTRFRKGDVLVHIDESEFVQSLYAQRSRFASSLSQLLADIAIDYPDHQDTWTQYLSDFEATEAVKELPEVNDEKFKLFLTGRGVYSEYFGIRQNENRLSKYKVVAPFTGVVTNSSINEGTLVRANQLLGEFIRTGYFEIEASVNINDVNYIKLGDQVTLKVAKNGYSELVDVEVARINSMIDQRTQTVLVYFKVKSDKLIAGEFVEGFIDGNTFEDAQLISRDILVRDNLIFVIQDSVATLTEVDVLARTGDQVIIRALQNELQIINEFRSSGFEGTKVKPIED